MPKPISGGVLHMNSWPRLIEVSMPPEGSCPSIRETADLLRWSMGKEPRYGRGYIEYRSATSAKATPFWRRFYARLKRRAHAMVRFWGRSLRSRCRALSLRSCLPPTRD